MCTKTFILSVQPQYEKRVSADILRRKDVFKDAYIVSTSAPTILEEKINSHTKEKQLQTVMMMAGYVLVEVEMNSNGEIDPDTQHLLLSTPQVIGFTGCDRKKPTPISESEIRRIKEQASKAVFTPAKRPVYSQGERLDVFNGPFKDLTAVVVSDDGKILRAEVDIFNRKTVVELDYRVVRGSK